jgi:competence protein ComEC
VLRAAVMATIVLGALASGRPVRGLPVLSAAVVLLLVLDPWLAREFGFALSVLATAGLLTLAGPVTAFLSQYLPPVLAAGVAIPASAQLACQPVLILLDASIPTYGVVANILAAPAAPLATIVGLVSCLLSSLLPVLGTALAWLAWVPAVWIAGVASFFASLPLARLPWPEGEGGAAVLAVLSALGVVAMFSRARTRKWATLSLCVTLAIYSGVFGGGWLLGRAGRPDWQIAACDVGQGDSFVVRSLGQIAVIDAGKNPELLRDCLDDIGVSRIDLLVLTHFDLDHVGGVQATFGRVGVALVGETSSPDDEALLRNLADGGAEVQTATPGASGVLGELAWRIIWPSKRGGSLEPGNDASVVIEFRPAGQCADGCLSSMFLGDLGAVAQSRLLASGTLSTVDVVKVSHHGSADQDPRLYLAANATVGLIGVGENNYGHPDQRALNMLTAAATAAQRTDLDGLTLIAPGATAGSVMVWTQR